MKFVKEQVVMWKGTPWIVTERMPEYKSRIRNAEGETHVVLDDFLTAEGEIVACSVHGMCDATAPLFLTLKAEMERRNRGEYFESTKCSDADWARFKRSLNCGTCNAIAKRAICEQCGRVKDTEGNCENWGCSFPEAQQPAVEEKDVVEITVKAGLRVSHLP